MKFSIHILIFAAVATWFSACKNDDPDPHNVDLLYKHYTSITEKEVSGSGITVTLYTQEDPFVGYNRMVVKLTDASGENVSNRTVNFLPIMEMSTGMSHSCPFENPDYLDSLEAYEGSATFIMPSENNGNWTFHVTVNGDTVSFPLDVVSKTDSRLYSFLDSSDNKYFVTMIEPRDPVIDIQNFEMAIYEKTSDMSFPPVKDFSVVMEPEMPTMDHGSPDNENPEHLYDGHYIGRINLTMDGFWRVNLDLSKDGSILDSTHYFDINF